MRVLAIDHGKTTGYAVLEDDKTVLTNTFTLKEEDRNKKLYEFFKYVQLLIDSHKPDIIACEYPSDMLNAETARQLIGYFTIVKLHAVANNIPLRECFISSVRKCVTGTGKADKVNVCDALVAKLRIPREMVEEKVMYKSRLDKFDGKVKTYLYDKSDALALAFYTLYKDEPYIKGHGMYPPRK